MTKPHNQDWEDLVDSYMPAARALGMTREELDMQLRVATRFEKQCPSCIHSRAPLNARTQAERFGTLCIYERHCINKPPRRTCPAWEKLEPPLEVLS